MKSSIKMSSSNSDLFTMNWRYDFLWVFLFFYLLMTSIAIWVAPALHKSRVKFWCKKLKEFIYFVLWIYRIVQLCKNVLTRKHEWVKNWNVLESAGGSERLEDCADSIIFSVLSFWRVLTFIVCFHHKMNTLSSIESGLVRLRAS